MIEASHTITVQQTKDLGLFKMLLGNRELNKVQIKRLTKTLEDDIWFTKLSPILVNENMEVIDGQHRLQAYKNYKEAKTIDLPIFFIMQKGLTIKDARLLNAGSKPWGPKDYAKAYSEYGNANYKTYLKFEKETGLNYDILVRYLATDYSVESFRNGNFVVRDEKFSRQMFNNLDEVGMVIKASMDQPINWRHRGFAIGLWNIMQNPNYEQARMLAQLEDYNKILRTTDMKNVDISKALQKIYNKGQEEVVELLY